MPVRIVTAIPHQHNFLRDEVIETTAFVFVVNREDGFLLWMVLLL